LAKIETINGEFMSIFDNVGISQCLSFYTIQNDCQPTEIAADKDLFVGANVQATLTIPNGKTFHARDIVILGTLTIQSYIVDKSLGKGSLVARNFFTTGRIDMSYVDVKSKNRSVLSRKKFEQELQDKIIDWFIYQKECVDKIGLKSILI
jgi:hypothetical protein